MIYIYIYDIHIPFISHLYHIYITFMPIALTTLGPPYIGPQNRQRSATGELGARQIFHLCRKLCGQRRKVDQCAKVKAQSQHAETLEAGDQWMI